VTTRTPVQALFEVKETRVNCEALSVDCRAYKPT